jgi:hypothetical protein
MMTSEEMEYLQAIFDLAESAVTMLGIPAAIYLFFRENSKERLADQQALLVEQQENDTRLKEQYNQAILQLIQYPHLDKHDVPLEDKVQRQQQKRIYEMLISCFESSFMNLYSREEPELQRLWSSWADSIDEWLQQPNFANSLDTLLHGEDEEFSNYVLGRLSEIKSEARNEIDAPELTF